MGLYFSVFIIIFQADTFPNCTGGAARYIDVYVFGSNHIYQNPTPKDIYKTTQPFDPEGLLGRK